MVHVQMDALTVADPVVLAGLNHPEELDAEPKRTCTAAFGPSKLAGAEDGPNITEEGLSCQSDSALLEQAQADIQLFFDGLASGNFPNNSVPLGLVSTVALCRISEFPGLPGTDFSCQAEKPIALPLGPPLSVQPAIVPLQIFRLGNLALVGLPWEVTTMASRRLEATVREVLAPVGVDTVVIAGLVNDYVDYVTTREEYAIQHYEGASNIYGPWTLAALQQELRTLATGMKDGLAPSDVPDYVDGWTRIIRPPYVPSDLAPGSEFGSVVVQAPATATAGESVTFAVQGGHPRNNLMTQSSYVFVERKTDDGNWEVVAHDRDPELWFEWRQDNAPATSLDPIVTGASTAAAVWHLPPDVRSGVYRLRVEGVAHAFGAQPQSYQSVSSEVIVDGDMGVCPW